MENIFDDDDDQEPTYPSHDFINQVRLVIMFLNGLRCWQYILTHKYAL